MREGGARRSLGRGSRAQDWRSEPMPSSLPACLLWNAGRGWWLGLCWKAPPGGISFYFLSHVSPRPLHTYLLTGVPLQALTFSPFLQCLRSFGPLALLFPHPSFHQPLVPAPSGLEQTALLPSRQGSKEPAEGDGAQPEGNTWG